MAKVMEQLVASSIFSSRLEDHFLDSLACTCSTLSKLVKQQRSYNSYWYEQVALLLDMTIPAHFSHRNWRSVYKRLQPGPVNIDTLDILEDSYCVSLLLTSSNIDPAIEENWPIRTACARGYTETVRLLLADSRVDPTAKLNTALLSACMARHVEVVKLLMNHPAIDPTVYDMQAVQLAWEGCDLAMIEVLIQDARVVLYDPEAIFIEACTQGTSSLVFHLLDKYPITIAAHVRSFQHACSSGCVEIVAKLLTVQEVKEARYTLSRGLVMACAASRVDVVRLLLTVVNLASSENASYVSKIGNMYLANPRSYSGREREIAQLLLGMHR